MRPHAVGVAHAPGVAPVVQLRLLRSHGVACNAVLPLAETGTGMAGALALGGEPLSDAQWAAHNRCRIDWQAPHWMLTNGCHALVCAKNGLRLPLHVAVPVEIGDHLELGLMRFAFEGVTSTSTTTPTTATLPAKPPPTGSAVPTIQPVSARGSAGDQADADDFDLRDLARPPPERTPGSDRPAFPERRGQFSPDIHDEPFAILDIAGARRGSVSQPLADLLADRPSRSSTLPAVADSRGHADMVARPSPTTDEPTSWPVLDAPAAKKENPLQFTDSAGHAVALLFAELNAEFDRVVRDPLQLNGRADWDEGDAQQEVPTHVTIDDLSEQATQFPHLLDIFLNPQAIDTVLLDFVPLVSGALMVAPDMEEVLQLFAPARSRDARSLLPGLTQREHHDLSPDSYMNPGIRKKIEAPVPGFSPPLVP